MAPPTKLLFVSDKDAGPWHLTTGEAARVMVTGGPLNGTAIVQVNDGRTELQTDQLEIPLDEKGNGHSDWCVPPWPWVHFHCDGCDQVIRQVRPPRSRTHKLTLRFTHLLKRFWGAVEFITKDSGSDYGISRWQRFKLLQQVLRIRKKLSFPASVLDHLHLIQQILELSPSLKGDVVECGCWNGASTVSLSLACALTNRRLFVCDSFEGLPQPRSNEGHPFRSDGSAFPPWDKGSFASEGGREGVKKNVSTYGAIEVCHFVKGFFQDTLKDLPTDAIVLVYEDADLVSSVKDCLRYLWPKLRPGCKFFSDEPWSFQVVSSFYDEAWWKRELGLSPPGFFGSECGLCTAPGIGFAVKRNETSLR